MSKLLDPDIKNHIDKTLQALNSSREVPIDTLIESYRKMKPILHKKVDSPDLDLNVLNYSLLRLPEDIFTITKVLLVQSYDDIKSVGFDVTRWTPVTSLSRRRLTYINPAKNTIACLLSSESDIHDLISCLIAFHIERLKLKTLLNQQQQEFITSPNPQLIGLTPDQWNQLVLILGPDWDQKITATKFEPFLSIKMYGHNPPLYQVNCSGWINNLVSHSLIVGLKDAPIYFVSSNSHSLINVIGGFINQKSSYIFDYISQTNLQLYQQWFEIKKRNNASRTNDFLYYVAETFLKDNPSFMQEKSNYEKTLGIKNIKSTDAFQSNTQIIPLKSLSLSQNLDSNLKVEDKWVFEKSDAYIINIEYPLGYAAYFLLNEILLTLSNLRSAFIMGKAAILNGEIGDIQIPHVVYDEMTNNLYTFRNIFEHDNFLKSFVSRICQDQSAACVYGTFLENQSMINHYQQAGINIIEMESGPYLKTITEKFLLGNQQVAKGQQYDLTSVPFELGIINYASDNPLNQTLAEESITLRGIEPTYLSSLVVLQKIIDAESLRLSNQA